MRKHYQQIVDAGAKDAERDRGAGGDVYRLDVGQRRGVGEQLFRLLALGRLDVVLCTNTHQSALCSVNVLGFE